ncbi:thioredoxin-disulfide reductase [Falsiruegeria mediterranea]
MHSKVMILGSGPAGNTAAIYAARAGLDPLLVHGEQPGGQLTITTDVDNYPGFADTVQGPWLMEQMEAQAREVGTQIVTDTIVSLDLSIHPFVAEGELGDTYTADTLILCTGAQAKWLGIAGETEYLGSGVSACATCDGPFFKGKHVAVVGGGNTAVEEALFLSKLCKQVTLIHRRDELRAEKMLQERLLGTKNIDVIWSHVPQEVVGENGRMTGLTLRSTQHDDTQFASFDGVFVAIGHSPNTGLVSDVLDLDAEGYVLTEPDSTRTSIAGVFAAGDVKDKIFRQAVTAAGSGCMAALEAEKFISESE